MDYFSLGNIEKFEDLKQETKWVELYTAVIRVRLNGRKIVVLGTRTQGN